MTTNTLYIYQLIKLNGKKKITKSLIERTDRGELIGTEYRLIADHGKVLTDGVITTSCIDTADPAQWTEIDEPEPEQENNEESED